MSGAPQRSDAAAPTASEHARWMVEWYGRYSQLRARASGSEAEPREADRQRLERELLAYIAFLEGENARLTAGLVGLAYPTAPAAPAAGAEEG